MTEDELTRVKEIQKLIPEDPSSFLFSNERFLLGVLRRERTEARDYHKALIEAKENSCICHSKHPESCIYCKEFNIILDKYKAK